MKSVFTVLLCLLFSTSIFAQTLKDSSFTDADGLCWKGKTENSLMTGLWIGTVCNTNKVLVVVGYLKGKKSGDEIQLNSLGKKKVIYRYKNGLLDGPAVYYYGNNGDTLGCVNYTNGVINGLWRICDTTGRTMRFVEWEMGKIKSAFPKVDKFTRNEPPRNYRDYAALTAEIMHNETDIVDQSTIETPIRSQITDDSVYILADVMPEYQGGMDSLVAYLRQNINYPQSCKDAGKQGTVYVEFIIRKTGEVTDVKVVKGVSGAEELDKEAVRVVKQMPAWKPALQNDKPVSAKVTLPIRFKLMVPSPKKD